MGHRQPRAAVTATPGPERRLANLYRELVILDVQLDGILGVDERTTGSLHAEWLYEAQTPSGEYLLSPFRAPALDQQQR